MLERKGLEDLNIYFINLAIVLFSSVLCKYNLRVKKRHVLNGEKVYGIIVCASFTFIMAFRDISVGEDVESYSRIFNTIAKSDTFFDAVQNAPLSAPAYVAFCRLLSYISQDPQILIVASSIIINICLMLAINKASTNAFVSYISWIGFTLLYCSMNGTRQCLALVLSLYALILLAKDLKRTKAWILLLIAVLTHLTALVLVFAICGIILTDKITENKMLFIISVLASFIGALCFGIGVRLVLNFMPRYSMYEAGGSNYSIFDNTGSGRIVFLYLVLLLILIIWIIKSKTYDVYSRKFARQMFPAVLFGVLFGIVNSKNILVNRLLWYYLGIYVLFLPDVFKMCKRNERIILEICVIAILLVYSILSLYENQNGIVPYKFFWE